MNLTKPFTRSEAARIKAAFSGRQAPRNQMLFVLGITTGFRIDELLSLQKKDIVNQGGKVVNEITIAACHMKGKKRSRTIPINDNTRQAIKSYIEKSEIETWMFPSSRTPGKAIDRTQGWRCLTEAMKKAGLHSGIGAHAMRKTFGTWFYELMLEKVAAGEKVDPMRATAKALGHMNISTTERYLNFDEKIIRDVIENIQI